jgi:hypothetical protein
MIDKSMETPVHFVEKNYDASYCWNGILYKISTIFINVIKKIKNIEWELRKKAI